MKIMTMLEKLFKKERNKRDHVKMFPVKEVLVN